MPFGSAIIILLPIYHNQTEVLFQQLRRLLENAVHVVLILIDGSGIAGELSKLPHLSHLLSGQSTAAGTLKAVRLRASQLEITNYCIENGRSIQAALSAPGVS